MKATITHVDLKRGMYADHIDETEDFVIFELLDSQEVELNDKIEHQNFYSMGGETFKNLTQDFTFEVFVEDVCGKNLVKTRCF